MGSMRIGFGYDSHRFDEARSLVLGGVRIPDHPGLLGHSDGDAIAHAVTDALLGAAALGDIGRLFPLLSRGGRMRIPWSCWRVRSNSSVSPTFGSAISTSR